MRLPEAMVSESTLPVAHDATCTLYDGHQRKIVQRVERDVDAEVGTSRGELGIGQAAAAIDRPAYLRLESCEGIAIVGAVEVGIAG